MCLPAPARLYWPAHLRPAMPFADTTTIRVQQGKEPPGLPAPEYAMFTELSPNSKLMKDGWNTRVFTNTDAQKGSGITCDFTTGIVTLAPGIYHIAGLSMVAYGTGGEPPEMTTSTRAGIGRLLPAALIRSQSCAWRQGCAVSRTMIPVSSA